MEIFKNNELIVIATGAYVIYLSMLTVIARVFKWSDTLIKSFLNAAIVSAYVILGGAAFIFIFYNVANIINFNFSTYEGKMNFRYALHLLFVVPTSFIIKKYYGIQYTAAALTVCVTTFLVLRVHLLYLRALQDQHMDILQKSLKGILGSL